MRNLTEDSHKIQYTAPTPLLILKNQLYPRLLNLSIRQTSPARWARKRNSVNLAPAAAQLALCVIRDFKKSSYY